MTAPVDVPASLAAAYAHCLRTAREHYENFPVASWLLPAASRPHIAAIYAFARRADDFADEPGPEPSERLRLLDDWRRRLHGAASSGTGPDELIFAALHHSIRACRLPVGLFDDLLSAFEQDVTTTRYATWPDVFDYCRRSANPVGRLVLRVAGYDSPDLDRASDAVCTALQLTNFWQDFGRDWANGRVYIPAEESERHGAREADLEAGRMTDAWRQALRAAVGRTRDLFAQGWPVCAGVTGRLRWELRLTLAGGIRILDRIEQAGYDTLGYRPSLGAGDALSVLARAFRGR